MYVCEGAGEEEPGARGLWSPGFREGSGMPLQSFKESKAEVRFSSILSKARAQHGNVSQQRCLSAQIFFS